MTTPPNVLGNSPLTRKSLRTVVGGIIRNIQARYGESDGDTADRLGCSASTIRNARNEENDLHCITVTQIGRAYGLAELQPLAELIGAKLVPLAAERAPDLSLPCIVTRFQLELSLALEDGKLDAAELNRMRPAIEALGAMVDDLRERMTVRAA